MSDWLHFYKEAGTTDTESRLFRKKKTNSRPILSKRSTSRPRSTIVDLVGNTAEGCQE